MGEQYFLQGRMLIFENEAINVKYKRIVINNFLLYQALQQLLMLDQHHQQESVLVQQSPKKETIANLIDTIDFFKKSKAKSTISMSDADSISSGQSIEGKQKSKVWTEEQIELFHILLKKYGTDFHILSSFFPKKTKNQLKNRYKQYMNMERKKEKQYSSQLKAVSLLFQQVQQKSEKEQAGEKYEDKLFKW